MISAIRRWLHMDPEPAGHPFRAPVFIIGCMRSGTTFLVDKLTQHPQLLKVGAELREVWTDIGGAPCGGSQGTYRGEADASPIYAANMARYFTDFIHQSQSPIRHLMRAKQKWKQGSSAIFYDWEQVFPVNKSTHLVNKIQYLHALFPAARFVFILRDIMGQCASLKIHAQRHFDGQKWLLYAPASEKDSWGQGPRTAFPENVPDDRFFPHNFELLPAMWLRLNALAINEISQLPADLYRIIDYTDLVQAQDSILRQTLDFLPLAAKHASAVRQIAATPMKIINTTVAGNPLDKWKKTLTDDEIKLLQRYKEQPAYTQMLQMVEELKLRPTP